ncbi:MAG: cobyrinate a,c-diamide synthase [Gemmatimonadetes bacterium]|nr:cobyrinate a,c-diamide synthase [Gemmatimonadota bacterium]
MPGSWRNVPAAVSVRRFARATLSRCTDLQVSVPRLLVAGLRGGGGKTLLSLGLAASFRSRGHGVAPFKKGPDYIDASWLSHAAGRPCRNLDLFLFSPPVAIRSFLDASKGANIAIIEGNRGLYDGMDAEGSFSSGELAKLLKAPVVLSVDVTKTTRTAAAQILGCQTLDPEVSLAGVVLSRVAGSRHESVLRESIEGICGIPVLGAIPKLPEDIFPERHLGLVPPQETELVEDPLSRVREVAEKYLDLDGILGVARAANTSSLNSELGLKDVGAGSTGQKGSAQAGGTVQAQTDPVKIGVFRDEAFQLNSLESRTVKIGGFRDEAFQLNSLESRTVKIGVFRDEAFQFYYPENLEGLQEAGGELVEIPPTEAEELPEVDALYLGGGFPETLAPRLSGNASFLESVRSAAGAGLPIYAECGGAVYLGKRLHYEGESYALAGVIPVEYGFQAKPRGHGYTVLETVAENPFFQVGETLRGHEFHYTYMVSKPPEGLEFAFKMHRGFGFDGTHDGLRIGNVLASYTHLHALGTPGWAPALVKAARRFKTR